MKQRASLMSAAAAATISATAALAAPAVAQSSAPGALPTAPGAERAGVGGYTGARASLPGDRGSPLEPYLYLFILAGGGIIAWGTAIGTDRSLQRRR